MKTQSFAFTVTALLAALCFFAGSVHSAPYGGGANPVAPPSNRGPAQGVSPQVHPWNGQGRNWSPRQPFAPQPGAAVVAKPPVLRPPVNNSGNPLPANVTAPIANAPAMPEFSDIDSERAAARDWQIHQAFLLEGALPKNPAQTISSQQPLPLPDFSPAHPSPKPAK